MHLLPYFRTDYEYSSMKMPNTAMQNAKRASWVERISSLVSTYGVVIRAYHII